MTDDPPAALLIAEVAKALKAGLAPGFAQKVAANALGIARRELDRGPQMTQDEDSGIAALLGEGCDTARLCTAIRDDTLAIEARTLLGHLIRTTIAKLEVDQPGYPAFRAWKDGAR